MGVGIKCAQIILFIINLIFLIFGLAMIIIGSIALTNLYRLWSLTGITNGVAIFLIVVGCILVIVSLFGCAGSWNKNNCMLVTYIICLVILLILVIIIIIVVYVVKDKITGDTISKEFIKTIPKYDANEVYRNTWDSIQRDNNCCGANYYTDWKLNKGMNETKSVPDSCCRVKTKGCGTGIPAKPTNIYTDGCVTSSVNFIKQNFEMIGIIAIITLIFLFLGILLAAYMISEIRKEYNTI